jgi:hypothetical protein
MESSSAADAEKIIEYPNFCQTYHIGFNNYATLKMDASFKAVSNSHDDVEQYEKFFKDLGYHKVQTFMDHKN